MRQIYLLVLCMVFCLSFAEATEKYPESAPVITVRKGKEFAITLESNPTTGYRWRILGLLDTKLIEFVRSEYRASANSGKIVGSGGTETWIFKAKAKGKTELILEYVRPWETDIPPAEKKKFTIVVQ